MNKQEIEFRDPVVHRVVQKFVSRSDIGFAKYGVTLEQDPSKMYLQKAKEVYTTDLQEDLLSDLDVDYEKII